ncbi:hypothetical protein CHRYSEOSP005_27540 [Chryseobacterium sp. Alg-005]|uniref:hypothetical protein n=1 Tax=Chryseobacterium sp. Alg-005 TaxID=3159516 RepID=UPI0035558332
MIKPFKYLAFVLLIGLTSCSHIIDEIDRDREEENYTTPYMGKWQGSYTGDENGTLTMNVNKSGSIEVIRTSGSFQETFYISLLGGGSGAIYTNTGSASGFIVYGSLESKSGTWIKGNMKGSWSVVKN